MKSSSNSVIRCNGKSFAVRNLWMGVILDTTLALCALALMSVLFTGCKKEVAATKTSEMDGINSRVAAEGNVVNEYTGLSKKTMWELQQVRAATARYRDIKNAIKDGYSNINVDVPNMGHHFMKTDLVDGTFDVRHPEILVYSGIDEGNPELVAVEYATNYTDANGNITTRPEGFTGSADVWKTREETGFPFWLVHAWVWKYNPDGVFSWTNPTVEGD
ncbi:MAG: hypothetical protein ACTHOF_09190 [Flavisolibacter sp.]